MEKNTIKYNGSRKQKKVFRGGDMPGMAYRNCLSVVNREDNLLKRKASLCPLNRFGYFFDKKYQTNPEFGKGKGDNSSRERGSALLVTIMITSVVLLFAMILLERIIPYSREIRGMGDAIQSYYLARSEIEIAKYEFGDSRENIDPNKRIIKDSENLSLVPPVLTRSNPSEYVILSESTHLPLHIRLYEDDELPRSFGLSPLDSDFHSLNSFDGGLLFDLTNRDTANFMMKIETGPTQASVEGNIGIEFVRNDNTTITPFFGNISTPAPLNGKNIALGINANGINLGSILATNNCLSASCALKLSLIDSDVSTIPVSFALSKPLPDLNAVIVADGLSPNAAYHSRIIELIPLIQGI